MKAKKRRYRIETLREALAIAEEQPRLPPFFCGAPQAIRTLLEREEYLHQQEEGMRGDSHPIRCFSGNV